MFYFVCFLLARCCCFVVDDNDNGNGNDNDGGDVVVVVVLILFCPVRQKKNYKVLKFSQKHHYANAAHASKMILYKVVAMMSYDDYYVAVISYITNNSNSLCSLFVLSFFLSR